MSEADYTPYTVYTIVEGALETQFDFQDYSSASTFFDTEVSTEEAVRSANQDNPEVQITLYDPILGNVLRQVDFS